MSKQKQTTLFSTVGPGRASRPAKGTDPGPPADEDVLVLDDEVPFDDFDDLIMADEGELFQACDVEDGPSSSSSTTTTAHATAQGARQLKQSTIPFHIGPSASSHSILNHSIIEDEIPGFDLEAGELWIYPTNYPVRDYQFNIAKKALFINTLVCLPTGLGKTFIAAVVMYNYFRWYPNGKIVFLAPTKPLVAQQIEACYNVMGIPQEDMAEMTGGALREVGGTLGRDGWARLG